MLDSYDLSSVQKPFLQHSVTPFSFIKNQLHHSLSLSLTPPLLSYFPLSPSFPLYASPSLSFSSPSYQIPFNSLIDSIDGGLDGDTPPVVSVLPGLTKSSYLFSQNQMENIVIGGREEERERGKRESEGVKENMKHTIHCMFM